MERDVVCVRIDKNDLQEIDAFVLRKSQQPGEPVWSRSDVIRYLLHHALEVEKDLTP